MKVLNIRICHGGLLFLLLGGILGCNRINSLGLAQTPVTPINQLSQYQQPDQDTQTEDGIYLQGTVVDSAPFMDNGSYQLQDETGTVWVLTNGTLPKPGDAITIKGQVEYQSISIGDQDLGELYIVEVEQLDTQPQPPNQQAQPVSSPQTETQSKPKPDLDINDLLLPHKSNSK